VKGEEAEHAQACGITDGSEELGKGDGGGLWFHQYMRIYGRMVIERWQVPVTHRRDGRERLAA